MGYCYGTVEAGVYFIVRTATYNKYGNVRIAIIKTDGTKTPSRIDKRIKCVKTIFEVRHFNSRRSSKFDEALQQANAIADKLNRLWPCHFLAKEYPKRKS